MLNVGVQLVAATNKLYFTSTEIPLCIALLSHLIKFPICVSVYNTVFLVKIFLHKITKCDFLIIIANAT